MFCSTTPGTREGTEQDMRQLMDAIVDFQDMADRPIPFPISCVRPENPQMTSPKYLFCCAKIERLHDKLNTFTYTFLRRCSDLAQDALALMAQFAADGNWIRFDVTSFRAYLTDLLSKIEGAHLKTLLMKMTLLDQYADQLYQRRFPPIGHEQLEHCLVLSAKGINVTSCYTEWSDFDDRLVLYELERGGRCFQQSVQNVLSKKAVNWREELDRLTAHLGAAIDISKPEEELLFKNAVHRRFFEVLYVERPKMLDQKNQGLFLRNCKLIANLTPRQWLISQRLDEEMMDLTWKEIYENSEIKAVNDAFQHLILLQFASCPLDMAWHCLHAFDCIRVFADEKAPVKGVMREFDGCNEFFFPFVAVAAPSNAVTIMEFANMFRVSHQDMLFWNQLMFFEAAVQFILEYQ